MPSQDEILETVHAIARHGACAHSRKLIEHLLANQVRECSEIARSVEMHLAANGKADEARTAGHIGTAIKNLAR